MSPSSRKNRHYADGELVDRSEAVQLIREGLLARPPARPDIRRSPDELPQPDASFELVPTANGEIAELCVAIPNSIFGGESAVMNVYIALLRSLAPNKKVFIICDPARIESISQILQSSGVRCECCFVPFQPSSQLLPFGTFEQVFTNWVQDPFIATQSLYPDNRIRLVEPCSFFDMGRRVDSDIADSLAKVRGLTTTQTTNSVFMGGNVLSLADHVLVGADELYHHEILLPDTEMRSDVERECLVASRLCDHLQTSKQVLFVRASAVLPQAGAYATTIDGRDWREETVGALNRQSVQPVFHIDMFITPTGVRKDGRDIVLVGDPSLAASQLNRVTTDAMMIPAFDEIADFLAQHFHIIRNPLPLVFMDADDGKKIPERKWYFASYNNALVEADENVRRVWLPSYGFGNWLELVKTDDSNRHIWRDLGFSIEDVGDCHALAERRGGLHCIANVIRRQASGIAG